jgi:hypothetical protein
LDTLENRSEVPEKSKNVVQERNDHQLEQSCEKCQSIIESQEGNENPTYNEKVEGQKLIGHILHKKCLLKHVM